MPLAFVRKEHKTVTRGMPSQLSRSARTCAALLISVGATATCPVAAGETFSNAAPLPEGRRLFWGREPVETISMTRRRICLNGLWACMPARGPSVSEPAGTWGYIPVPGVWAMRGNAGWMPTLCEHGRAGSGPEWNGLDDKPRDDAWGGVARMWYRREVAVPTEWKGRRVLLELCRVSTDAQVMVNGQACGEVHWPRGRVDLTPHIRFGGTNDLRMLVVATDTESTEKVFMGSADAQVFTRKSWLPSRGLLDDVFLHSTPAGPRVSDVFVQTSTRRNELVLDVELSDVTRAGRMSFSARCLDEAGDVEIEFSSRSRVISKDVQRLRLTWSWDDPRLWDLDQPELYTLQLRARGAGLDDEYRARFGFREFWIEGRKIMLNGTEIRFRPCVIGNQGDRSYGTIEKIDGAIDGFRAAGFNVQEFWPWNHERRGNQRFEDLWFDRADRKGWLLFGAPSSMSGLVDTWDEPGVKERWTRLVSEEIRRWRNHPSAVLWIHSANRFGNWQDQNPDKIGNTAKLAAVEGSVARLLPIVREANEIIRRVDPTRPVTTHCDSATGDLNTTNCYLNTIPFQEQEEWLSEWARSADKPFMPVEFDPYPVCTFRRGRNTGGWDRQDGGATSTEFLATEHLARYYGNAAHHKEG